MNKKNELLEKSDPYFTKKVKILEPKSKYLTNEISSSYPVSLFLSSSHRIFPHQNYELEKGALDLKKTKYGKLHWGQRKLFLTEIDFLTDFSSDDVSTKTLAVYAGAADGKHILFLSKIFPNIVFHLYDPREFYPTLKTVKQIHLNPYYTDKKIDKSAANYGFFTDNVAKYYSVEKKNFDKFIFISDIRTQPGKFSEDEEYNNKFEQLVIANQAEQKDWVHIMEPNSTMLKFKTKYPTPNNPKYYCYLKGHIRVQPWAGNTSTETRLIVSDMTIEKNKDDVCYDICHYEQQIAYYNNQMRLYDFSNKKIDPFGITVKSFWEKYISRRSYGADFCIEISILMKYLTKYSSLTLDNLNKLEQDLNSNLIDKGRKFGDYLNHI
jgi:hypothetical protein